MSGKEPYYSETWEGPGDNWYPADDDDEARHSSHEVYAPVGYGYRADNYCLACIPGVVAPNYATTYVQDDGCNCAECALDRIAEDRGIDRHDERSYDMDNFPKHIPYHNDLHSECGYADLEMTDGPSCYDCCARCGAQLDGPCPAMESVCVEEGESEL